MDSTHVHLINSDSINNVIGIVHSDTLIIISQNAANTSSESIADYKYLVPICISVGVFVLTLFVQYLNRISREYRERGNKLFYFAALVKSIIAHSEIQSQKIKEYMELLDNINQLPLFMYIPKNDLEKIVNKVDDESLFRAYTKKYNSSNGVLDYKSIVSSIEFQNAQIDQIIKMTEKHLISYNEKKKAYSELFDDTNTYITKEIVEHGFKDHPALHQVLHDRAEEFLKVLDNASIEKTYNDFVKLLLDDIDTKDLYSIPIAFEIANRLKSLETIYKNLIVNRDAFKKSIAEIYSRYNESTGKLKTDSTKFLKDFFDLSAIKQTGRGINQ